MAGGGWAIWPFRGEWEAAEFMRGSVPWHGAKGAWPHWFHWLHCGKFPWYDKLRSASVAAVGLVAADLIGKNPW